MTNLRWLRFGLVIFLIWLLGALASWVMFSPGAALVGAGLGGRGATPTYNFAPSNLNEAADVLKSKALWGVRRDGSVLPPPKPKDAEEKKVEWRILASVSKAKDRYIVIQIDKEKPVSLKEGERFPDGSQLLKIFSNRIIVQTADDEQKTINLTL